MLGDRIREAVEESEFRVEDIAAHVGMSGGNFRRLYSKDSTELKYIIKIAEKLNKPLGYFIDDETIGSILHSNSGQANYANKVGSNQQSISLGQDDCQQKLEACMREKALLEKSVKDKDLIIDLLRGGRGGY